VRHWEFWSDDLAAKNRMIEVLSNEPDGRLPWRIVRQQLGGVVKAHTFRRLVDELVADGRLIELWHTDGLRRVLRHSLVLPSRSPDDILFGMVELACAPSVAARLGLR
jgi:hypothetical protein